MLVLPKKTHSVFLLFMAMMLIGCSQQSAYIQPSLSPKNAWSGRNVPAVDSSPSPPTWWVALHDPAITSLIEAAFADNPTLQQAVGKMDEARAQVRVNKADYYPQVSASGSISDADTTVSGGGSGIVAASTGAIAGHSRTSSIEPSLSWELDLFGRVRSSVEVARRHLDARTADADSTRLSLAVEVADDVLDWRGCTHTQIVYRNEIASRNRTLNLIHKKLIAGFSSKTDEASALRDLAAAQVELEAQQETCTQYVNALVALSGRAPDAVTALLVMPLPGESKTDTTAIFMPMPPETAPQLPATVLLTHPSIVSADQDAAAAWANIGVARANRLPKIDLEAAFTGQWISAAGSTLSEIIWSLGPSFSATVFDAGKGAANVDIASAQYRQSVANLQATVRTTVQEVENALAAEQSASLRMVSSQQSAAAAKTSFTATQASWKSGMSSLLELEDSRRQYASAEDSVITAARDRAKAWVALVSATGNSITLIKSTDHE